MIKCKEFIDKRLILSESDDYLERQNLILAKLLIPFRLSQQKVCAEVIAALCEADFTDWFLIDGRISSNSEIQYAVGSQ